MTNSHIGQIGDLSQKLRLKNFRELCPENAQSMVNGGHWSTQIGFVSEIHTLMPATMTDFTTYFNEQLMNMVAYSVWSVLDLYNQCFLSWY